MGNEPRDDVLECISVRVTVRDGYQIACKTFSWQPGDTRARKRNHLALKDFLVVPDPNRTMAASFKMIEKILQKSDRPARAIVFDPLGCGESDYSERDMQQSADDLIDICDAFGLHHIHAIGIGAGAQTMLATAPKRPTLLGSFAMVDGGPVYDPVGLARAVALQKKAVKPKDWKTATQVTKAVAPGQFEALSDEDWEALARTIWREENGRLKPMITSSTFDDPDAESIDLWRELAVLKRAPALLLRGQHSPLIPPELAKDIARRHGRMNVAQIKDQGHTPYLRTAREVERLVKFLTL